MNSKDFSFQPGQSFSRRAERQQLESTRTTNKSRNESKCNERPNKTIINSFRIEPYLNDNLKCKHLESYSSEDDDSDDEEGEVTNDKDSSSLLESGEYDGSDEECDSICLVDPNSKKILRGSDVNKFYFSMTKCFNSLKDLFTTSTPNRPEVFTSRTSYPKNQSIKFFRESQQKRPTSIKKNVNRKSTDDLIITGDLKKDIKLRLKYDRIENSDWDEACMRRFLKYRYFMRNKNKFNDSLSIVPGIGSVYMSRLCNIIPNFGTLLEFYLSVNESTFKALLYAYANINSRYMNLINTSCKNYLKKYGFDFRDATVFIPKNARLIDVGLRSSRR
jgi:hypothetical protein